jgi:DNA-binding NarL/FixJ family response regulator
VIAITASDDRSWWARCVEQGAATVLPKTVPLRGLLEAVELLSQGTPVLSARDRVELLTVWHRQTRLQHQARARFSLLTDDELWVLGQLADGRIVQDIARLSGTPPERVLMQIDSIIEKLQVTSWLEAVELANDRGRPVTG